MPPRSIPTRSSRSEVSSLPVDAVLGKQLVHAGWKQGCALQPMPFAVVYDRAHPVTGAARAASTTTPILSTIAGPGEGERHLAMGRSRPDELLIVTTQTCDIEASPAVEPLVTAMRAFIARDPRLLAEARHSVRRFLIDPARGLVVDAAAPIVQIEKPVLLTLHPSAGAPNVDIERQFGLWLAQRSARAAFPTVFVQTVFNPIVTYLRERLGDPEFIFNALLGMRIVAPTVDASPYALNLIAIMPPDAVPGSDRANVLMREVIGLFESLRSVYVADAVKSFQYDARRLDELSARDHVASHPLYLD